MPTSTEEIDIAKLLINGRQGRAFRDFDRSMKEWLKAEYMHMSKYFCTGTRSEEGRPPAINDKLPVPVADTEDREAKSAALRAALLDFHRCVKSAKYITPRDAAPQPPAVS